MGASIAVLADGRVAVVDPDDEGVSLLDPATLERTARVEVRGEPRTLVPLASGELAVAAYRSGELALVDPASGAETGRFAVCAGPRGLAASPDGATLYVACESDGSVAAVGLADRSVRTLASGLTRPRALVALDDAVLVAEFVRGGLARVGLDGAVTRGALPPGSAPYRPALTRMTGSATYALAVSGAYVYAAHLLVNHDGDSSAEPIADDYGSVADGNPKINPAVTAVDPRAPGPAADAPALYAAFDGGTRAFQGPSALAAHGDRYLLVAHLNTHDVAVIDRAATDPARRVVGGFQVGHGAAGVAVDAARSVAYVDNAFDRSVSRLDLSAPMAPGSERLAAALTRVRAMPSFSPAAEAGRKVFFDARDRHITPAGVVACATCHPDGGDDGLVWFIHTKNIPAKRRRTPAMAQATTAAAPFHWDGEFATMKGLVDTTIRELMAGDGLLVDGEQVRAFVDEIVKPPPPPTLDAASVARGEAVYRGAGCGVCHGEGGGAPDGKRHGALLAAGSDPLLTLAEADTPSLRGVGLQGPYFHDGRSPDLRDALTRPDAAPHHGASLGDADLDDLIAYLRSL